LKEPWGLICEVIVIDGRFEVEVAYANAGTHWGQGLATEAAQAIKAYGFDTLGLTRSVSLINNENVASICVAKKIEMVFEKERRDDLGSFLLFAI
jgi:ribosomal-protein-alanine N-acetyltransferase